MKKEYKILIISLTIAFLILSFLVKCNLIDQFDNFIYKIVTLNMHNNVTVFYKIITFLGSTKFIVGLCAFFLILFIILKKKNKGFIITSVLVISTLINNLLKVIFCRVRPEVIKFVEEHTYSYPSGHTMAAVSMCGILIYLILKSNINKSLKIILSTILIVIAILVGISRIYLGAHFASDVLGSFLVAAVLLLIEIYIIDKNAWL